MSTKTTDATVARARQRARLQAETAIMQLGPGRLLPYQREHLLKMAEEFGEQVFAEALPRVLAANDVARQAGNWPGFSQPHRGIAHRSAYAGPPQHPGTSLPIGASVADERHIPGTAGYAFERMSARDKHDFLKTYGEAAYAALREDWVRRGSPR